MKSILRLDAFMFSISDISRAIISQYLFLYVVTLPIRGWNWHAAFCINSAFVKRINDSMLHCTHACIDLHRSHTVSAMTVKEGSHKTWRHYAQHMTSNTMHQKPWQLRSLIQAGAAAYYEADINRLRLIARWNNLHNSAELTHTAL